MFTMPTFLHLDSGSHNTNVIKNEALSLPCRKQTYPNQFHSPFYPPKPQDTDSAFQAGVICCTTALGEAAAVAAAVVAAAGVGTGAAAAAGCCST
jgi:hypothetical protein